MTDTCDPHGIGQAQNNAVHWINSTKIARRDPSVPPERSALCWGTCEISGRDGGSQNMIIVHVLSQVKNKYMHKNFILAIIMPNSLMDVLAPVEIHLRINL